MTLNNNTNSLNNNTNSLKNNTDSEKNNTDAEKNNILFYTPIDTNLVKCNMCDKQLTRRSFSGHKSVCKRVPKNTCGYSTKIKCNFIKHQNRKTKCGDKTGISVHSDSLPVHVPVHSDSLPVHSDSLPVHSNNIPVHSNNIPVHSGTKDIVEYVDDANIKCLKCNGTYHPSYMARHLQMCQNIPLTTCEFCLSNFSSKQSKCNHKKNCKQKQRLDMIPRFKK
jgi:hypothetical protein